MDISGTSVIVLLITEFFMVFFLVLGYMVGYRGRLDLLRGYDMAQVRDRSGLGRFVGNNLIALGILAGIVFLFEMAVPDYSLVFFFGFIVTIPVFAIITALGSRRFDERQR